MTALLYVGNTTTGGTPGSTTPPISVPPPVSVPPTTPGSSTPDGPTNPETISGVCAALLLSALVALGTAGVGMATAASLLILGPALLIAAGITAASGLALLGAWILTCRDCRAIRYLQRYFAVLGVVLLALVPLLLGVGLPGPSAGAFLNVLLFGAIVVVLTVGANRLDCPNPSREGAR